MIHISIFQQVCAKSLELSKVIRLLEDPLTVSFILSQLTIFNQLKVFIISLIAASCVLLQANLKERHLFVLKKLLKRSQIGFVSFPLSSAL